MRALLRRARKREKRQEGSTSEIRVSLSTVGVVGPMKKGEKKKKRAAIHHSRDIAGFFRIVHYISPSRYVLHVTYIYNIYFSREDVLSGLIAVATRCRELLNRKSYTPVPTSTREQHV